MIVHKKVINASSQILSYSYLLTGLIAYLLAYSLTHLLNDVTYVNTA